MGEGISEGRPVPFSQALTVLTSQGMGPTELAPLPHQERRARGGGHSRGAKASVPEEEENAGRG